MGQSIRELKALLAAHGVDCSHCCEKAELQQLLSEVEAQEPRAPASPEPAAAGEETEGQEQVLEEPPAPSLAESLAGSAEESMAEPLERAERGQDAETSQAENYGHVAAVPAAVDVAAGLSVRELKSKLAELGVDFSHCREKPELQQLLREMVAKEQRGPPEPFHDGGFAVRKEDGRRCWVEFVSDGDALCHWDDGTDAIIEAQELEPVEDETLLPGPSLFSGTFEEARTEAFHTGRLLVAAVQGEGARWGTSKLESLQALVLASEEVALLIQENAVFWRGSAAALRQPHLQQLAPDGAPSLAMVLPLAVDAMRVLSHSLGTGKEAAVDAFVGALEALETHREQAELRLFSETAQLRQMQDDEFLESLELDRLAEEARRAKEAAAAEAGAAEATMADAEAGQALQTKPETAQADAGKRPGEESEREQERLAKARRILADEFLEDPAPSPGAGNARLVLRLPTGERVQRTFGGHEPLSRVHSWAQCCSLLPEAAGRNLQVPEHFELTTAFPPRRFGEEEAEQTLAALGLTPSAALLLIDKGA